MVAQKCKNKEEVNGATVQFVRVVWGLQKREYLAKLKIPKRIRKGLTLIFKPVALLLTCSAYKGWSWREMKSIDLRFEEWATL